MNNCNYLRVVIFLFAFFEAIENHLHSHSMAKVNLNKTKTTTEWKLIPLGIIIDKN